MATTDAPTKKQSSGNAGDIDPEVEAQVRERQRQRKERESREAAEGASEKSPTELMEAAAAGKELSEEEVHDALELYLTEEGEDGAPAIEPRTLKLNVGTTKKPKMIKWTVAPIDDAEITRIRKMSVTGSKAQRRRGDGDVDEALVARRIVARATLEPDMAALVTKMNEGAKPSGPEPADAVLKFFRRFGKTGLIIQISGEVLNISGYDEDDVSELEAAQG